MADRANRFLPQGTSRAGAPGFGREWLLLAATLLLATLLRVGWPTLAEFKFDEARLSALALELVREGHLPLAGLPSSAGFAHSPINVYLYAPAFLFGPSPLLAIVYSGLLGVAAVALCWAWARRWPGSGAWSHRLAALLCTTSPWLVVFSRKVWQIALVPPLALVCLGLLISALVEGRRWHLAWALVAYALLVQVHPSAAPLAVALLLWLVIFRRQVRAGPLAVGGVLGLATALPFLIYQVQEGWPLLAALQSLPQAVTDLEAVRLAWQAITGSDLSALAGDAYPRLSLVPALARTFHLAGFLVLASGILLAWRAAREWRSADAERRRAAGVDLVLLSWLAVPVLFNLRHSLDLHLHSFALIAPAAYLVAGRALDALGREASPSPARRALRALGLVTAGWLVAAQVLALLLMARFVAGHATPGGFGRPLGQSLAVAQRAVDRVREGNAVELLVVGPGDSPATQETPAIWDLLLRGRVAYRFVDGRSAALFPPHPALALITPDAGPVAALYDAWPAEELADGFRLVDLDGSWPAEDLQPLAAPRTFENGLEMQGYRWQGRFAPGEGGSFWLLWQVLWISPDSTHLFVHLLDGEGHLIGQRDTEGVPTALRRKGDRVINKFDIAVVGPVSPGPYRARLGVYRYPEVVNRSLIDGAGRPVGESILIGPLAERPAE
jgi:hypothetical protein